MIQYFKREAESVFGQGFFYAEFCDGWATRQVEVYNGRWFCSKQDFHPGLGPALADQPLSEIDLGPEHEIVREEFEEAWKKALEFSR